MYFQVIGAINVCKPTIRDDKINQFSPQIEPNDRFDRSEIKLEGKCGQELQGELKTWIEKPVELKLERKHWGELERHSEIKLEGECAIQQRQFAVEFNGEYQGKCFGLSGKCVSWASRKRGGQQEAKRTCQHNVQLWRVFFHNHQIKNNINQLKSALNCNECQHTFQLFKNTPPVFKITL